MKCIIRIFCLVVLLTLAISASAEGIVGSWAYIHAPDEPAFILNEDGSAELDGEKYTYVLTDEYVELTDDAGAVQRLRYVPDGENIQLYKTATYTDSGETKADGLIGVWHNDDTHWSYEFTDKGTFIEDGYFPGYYSVDEQAGTFKLMYVDQFADTTCYYRIDGDTLYVDYPWTMVRA